MIIKPTERQREIMFKEQQLQHASFLTFCIQHFRKKKQNILLCSIFTSLLLILVKTTYNVKDIREDLRHTNIRQSSLINDEGRDPLYPNQ